MINRRPIVGVMGSGREGGGTAAVALGECLARLGVHLLTGGGPGVMETVCAAFAKVSGREGLVVGIVPSTLGDPLCRPKPGYPNPWVELAIRTHLPLSGEQGTDRESRNHINVLTSDVVIALPGGAGTRSELTLALRYGKPVAVLLAGGATFPNLPDGVSRLADVDAVRAFVLRHLA